MKTRKYKKRKMKAEGEKRKAGRLERGKKNTKKEENQKRKGR